MYLQKRTPPKRRCALIIGHAFKPNARDGLEAMQNTGGEFKAVRRGFFVSAIVFNLFLSETGHRKEARTLGERIVVTQSHEPTIEGRQPDP